MIPVIKQQEPTDFNEKVRKRGQLFLKNNPLPNSRQFQCHNYWTHIKGTLYQLYKNICAYTGEWFPETSASVDHFIPKSKEPQLAYEWNNYRLTTDKMNNHKGDSMDIVDPFEVQFGWFVLVFPICAVKPGKNLTKLDCQKVDRTINVLGLNSDERMQIRYNIIQSYIDDANISYDSFGKKYPYIAYELKRQGLAEREKISDRFKPLRQ